MKDWTGNGNSIFKILGASNHTDKERETDDFYATSPRAIDALLEYADLHLPRKIWEPSCGTGCLSLRLTERGYDVTSTDLIDRGFGTGGINFFEQRQMPDDCTAIVTNPPYKYATEYVRHSLRLLPDGGWLCLFLKTTFAEGQERYREIFSPTPPFWYCSAWSACSAPRTPTSRVCRQAAAQPSAMPGGYGRRVTQGQRPSTG